MKDVIRARNRPFGIGALDQRDWQPGLDISFFQNSKVPARASVANHQRRQLMHAPAPREFPARLPRLAHFKLHAAHAEDVADTYRFFVQTSYGEIFAKSSERHIGGVEFISPFWIVIGAVS